MAIDFNDPQTLKEFVYDFFTTFSDITDDEDEENSQPTNVSAQVFQERLNICYQCEHFSAIDVTCGICGFKLGNKVDEVYEKCPLEEPKWGYDMEGWNRNYFARTLYEMDDRWKEELTEFIEPHLDYINQLKENAETDED